MKKNAHLATGKRLAAQDISSTRLLRLPKDLLKSTNVTIVSHQHLDGAPGPEVGPEHLRDPLGRRDVDGERLRGAGHLGLGVQEGDGGHPVGRCVQQVSEDK